MDIFSAIEKTFTNMPIVSAITSTIFIVLLGYYLRRKGVFGENFNKVLTKVVLSVSVPALAFNSFMQPIDQKSMHQGMGVLVWGILIYIIFIFLTPCQLLQ